MSVKYQARRADVPLRSQLLTCFLPLRCESLSKLLGRLLKKCHDFLGNWITLMLHMNLKETLLRWVLKTQGGVEHICWSLLSCPCRSHQSLQVARLCTRALCVAKALGSLAFRDLVNFLYFVLLPMIAESRILVVVEVSKQETFLLSLALIVNPAGPDLCSWFCAIRFNLTLSTCLWRRAGRTQTSHAVKCPQISVPQGGNKQVSAEEQRAWSHKQQLDLFSPYCQMPDLKAQVPLLPEEVSPSHFWNHRGTWAWTTQGPSS